MSKDAILYVGPSDSVHTWLFINAFKAKGFEVGLAYDGPKPNIPNCYNLGLKTFNGVIDLLKHPLVTMRGTKDVTHHRLSRYIAFHKSAVVLKQAIQKFKPDVVHAHGASSCGIYTYFTGFHPYIISTWGSDMYVDPLRPDMRPFIQNALERADVVHVESERQELIARGLGAREVVVQGWGVDLSLFRPIKPDENFRRKLGIESKKVIISVRELFNQKYGINTIIDAYSMVKKRVKDVKLLICNDGVDKPLLEQQVRSHGLQHDVIFTGRIPQDALPQYYNLAHIYVQNPRTDSVSYSLLEAMACGLPVISSNVGDTRENLRDGRNGLLFPHGNRDVLAEKMLNLLSDENFRRKLGNNARKWVEEHCDRTKAFENIETKLYLRLHKRCAR